MPALLANTLLMQDYQQHMQAAAQQWSAQ